MKQIWITSLDKNPQVIGPLLALAKQYGLAADGHFFTDDPSKLAWQPPLEKLLDPAVGLWIIVGSQEPLTPSVGYGLSLLTLSLGQRRNLPPMLWLDPSGTLDNGQLPTLLQNAMILPLQAPTLGAKIVAAANRPAAPVIAAPYRMAVHANEGYGIWLEIGPGTELWDGSMVGVAGAGKIAFQGVGPAGQLPQKTVLEYPQQGLTLMLGTQEYTTWAVRNPITTATSHFVKIDGVPDSILFGPYTADEQAEVFVVQMGLIT
jgi:hypothetical protein